MTKIALEKLFNAFEDWCKSKQDQRLGQFLCNTFNITDSVLFYEKDTGKVWEYFFNNY